MTALENYIPKKATEQSLFLKKYPEYDGRGIKIGIIDSDIVDKSLPGMQQTSTGLPKIIDFIGKFWITVDTSTVVKSNGTNFIIGLSGRKLMIPSKFNNSSDEWHLGAASFEKIYEEDDDSYCEGDENYKEKINKKVNNEIGDCIVWFDGEKWQACIIESSFSGNLDDLKVLSNFDDEHKVAYLPGNVPYCINIFDDGNLLQLSSPYDDHGTAVSHVAAAYFLDQSEKSNGLAPGAQIVSIRAGSPNGYLNENLLKVIEYGVDIVNLSFCFPVIPSIVEIIKKMVEEHGIIITFAAGNEGPFCASISENSSEILEYLFVIGAIYPEEMRSGSRRYPQSCYSIYDFSSKGPILSCGARGVDFVAPGLAITDLPKWYPNKNEKCGGTSFAAPNAAGAIACLLSGLKANSIPYTPALIKMALAKTAFLPKRADKLAFGDGIIQINNAFQFIKKSINNLPMKSLTPISIDQPKKKGIISFQSKSDVSQEFRYHVNVDPAMNDKWTLKITPAGNKFISISKTGNFFIVKIDSKFLEDGSINYAEISGIGPNSKPSTVPLFCLPITVICPADSFINKKIFLNPGPPLYYFFKIPSESKKCSIKICLLQIRNDVNIKLEHRQKKKDSQCWCAEHDSIKKKHNLTFTACEPINTLEVNVEEKYENIFEICIYHFHSCELKFMLNVEFE